MPKVLIVEDDNSMAVALEDGFRYEEFDVTVARNGDEGLRQALAREHDLVILDVMLPKVSGLDILKQIRRESIDVPVIMLTARGQEIDKVLGLKLGADDYVTKPFSFMELIARAEAVLRRANGSGGAVERAEFGTVRLDFKTLEARKDGAELELSPREFKILQYMVQHRGEVLAREQLLEAVWGYESVPYTRTVDMHIAKLRKKIEDSPSDPRHIVTIHGVGYKFTG